MKWQNQKPWTIRYSLETFVRLTLAATAIASHPSAKADSWATMGSLKSATLFHTSTLLPNGKVLIAGGQATNDATHRAELFNPATGAWTNTGAMSTNRFVHTATLLLNGKVLVTGGWAKSGFTNVLASAELYDPATGLWTNTGSMNTRRAYHQAVLLPTGKVLVTGGSGNQFTITKSAEIYDPSTGAWTTTGAMTSHRVAFAAVLLSNGKVLAAGGEVEKDIAVSSAEIYNPSNGLWTGTGSMAHERADFTATVLANGKVLAIGGWDNTSVPADTEVYDPSTETWAISGALKKARYHTRATLLQNGKVIVSGGEVYDTAFSVSELFDPSDGTWASAGSLNTPRRLHSLTLLSNGKVLVAGGVNTDLLSSAELYDSPPGTVSPVILTGMAKTPGGAFQFGFTSVPISGAAFTVYSSTNIETPLPQWTALGGVMEVLPGQFKFVDAQATSITPNFYRVWSP